MFIDFFQSSCSSTTQWHVTDSFLKPDSDNHLKQHFLSTSTKLNIKHKLVLIFFFINSRIIIFQQ